jgi:NitT/TauT family transport system substrate-binding protein
VSLIADFTRFFRLTLVLIFACVALPIHDADAQTSIKFSLSRKIDGTVAPLLVAVDNGYFKAEGLDIMIMEPSSPGADETLSSVVQRVADGEADMGFGDINTLIRLRAQAKPVPARAVYVLYNKPGYAVIGRKSRGILIPKNLEGATIGSSVADSALAYWRIFARVNALDDSKIKFESVSEPVREPMLAAGQVDAVIGLSFISYTDLLDRGIPASDVTLMLMGDYGVQLYGQSVIVSDKFAASTPEAVKGFLRALTKGLKETIARPQNAIDSVIKRNADLRKALELERLKLTIRDNVLTPEAKTLGFGAIDLMRLEKSIDQLETVYEYKTKPRAADIFDDSFLPSAVQRKTN